MEKWKKKVFHRPIHFPNSCNSQSWADCKMQSRSLLQAFYMQSWRTSIPNSKNLGHALLLSQVISRELGQKWSRQETNSIHTGRWLHRHKSNALCHHTSPEAFFLMVKVMFTLRSYNWMIRLFSIKLFFSIC